MSKDLILSAVDFLGLSEERLVCRVDLSEINRQGILFVAELTADQKTAVLPRPKGKAKIHKDQSMEIDWSQLSPDAATKFLKACLVTLKEPDLYFVDGAVEMSDTAVIPLDEMSSMYDQIAIEKGGLPSKANDALGKLPNAVVDLIVKKIRAISGLDDDNEDDDEGKKAPS